MGNLSNRVPGTLKALSKAQFESNRQQVRNNLACSGMVEYGKHQTSSYVMGEGMYAFTSHPSAIFMGRHVIQGNTGGTSTTNYPILNVDGIMVHIRGGGDTTTHVNHDTIKYDITKIDLPDAPNAQVETSTTTTRDYVRGDHVVVGNDIYVCVNPGTSPAGTSLLNDLHFESRELVTDEVLVGVEVFGVELGKDIDVVYPYGNVQNLEQTWEGFTLDSSITPDRYSEFGNWQGDDFEVGRGYTWSTMTASERNIWLSEAANNIYEEDGKYYQWQYRLRSARGNGEAWAVVRPNVITNSAIRTSSGRAADDNGKLRVRGKQAGVFEEVGKDNGAILLTHKHSSRPIDVDPGIGVTREGITDIIRYVSDTGIAYYLPIATVTRYNQGGYHPILNPMGTSTFRRQDVDADNPWHVNNVYKPQTVADCFNFADEAMGEGVFPHAGTYASGKSGHPLGYKHDLVYDHLVNDLRLNAHGVDLSAEDAAFNLTYGLTQGWEPVKKTTFHKSTISDITGWEVTLTTMPDKISAGGYLYNTTKGLVENCFLFSSSTEYLNIMDDKVNPHAMPPGVITGSATGPLDGNWEVGDEVIYITYQHANISLRAHTATDVISTPSVISDWLLSYGISTVYGMDWIPQLPDGTVKEYKAVRRAVLTSNQSLTSNDGGAAWVGDTSYISNYLMSTNANYREMYPNQIQLIQYLYNSGPIGTNARLPYVNGKFSSVWASASSEDNEGGLLAQTLLGDVPTGMAAGAVRYSIERDGLKNAGGVFYHDTTTLQRVAHTELDNFDTSHGIKYLVSLGYNAETGLVYSQVHYKKLFYQADDIPVQIIDLSTGPTVALKKGDRFKLINTRNSNIEGVVLSSVVDYTNTWGTATFDHHRINYDDGRIYRENGTNMGIAELAPLGNYGDDGEMHSPTAVTGIAAYYDLNGNRGISGSMLSRNPLGFLPKKARR